jgi:hypothetical protein
MMNSPFTRAPRTTKRQLTAYFYSKYLLEHLQPNVFFDAPRQPNCHYRYGSTTNLGCSCRNESRDSEGEFGAMPVLFLLHSQIAQDLGIFFACG